MNSDLIGDFSTRLAAGLACMLVVTSARSVGVQYFRTLLLVVLGLSVLAAMSIGDAISLPGGLAIASAALAFVGFVLWTLGRATGGKWACGLLLVANATALAVITLSTRVATWEQKLLEPATASCSALLLGSVTAAMLLGHSYLIAPTMSIDPLKRLIGMFAFSLVARAMLAAIALTALELRGGAQTFGPFWIGARWIVGLVIPACLAWMVWQTAKIRSTQSATGILYAGVVLVFFGELTGSLLASPSGIEL